MARSNGAFKTACDIQVDWKREPLALISKMLFYYKLTSMDTWHAPTVHSRQPVTYRLIESVSLGGPRWHGSSWQRGIAESGSSRLLTPMIDTPGDLVWDLPCVQQASYLEGGPPMWCRCCPYTCMLIKDPVIWINLSATATTLQMPVIVMLCDFPTDGVVDHFHWKCSDCRDSYHSLTSLDLFLCPSLSILGLHVKRSLILRPANTFIKAFSVQQLCLSWCL